MPAGNDWELTFVDDFDGSVLNSTKWTAYDGQASDGLGTFRAANVSLSGGALHLRVDSNADSARISTGYVTGGPKWLGGYGWYEARVRLPQMASGSLNGAWHAFWLWGENNQVGSGDGPQELDFEMRGNYSTSIRVGHIWQITPTKLSQGIDAVFSPYDGQWHTYAYDWRAGQIDWYIDDVLVHTYNANIPASPLQILLDAKVGGSFAGAPDGSTVYPFVMDVDYVKVWQKANRNSQRWYQRLVYGGALDTTQQARYLAAIQEVGAKSGNSGTKSQTRVVGAQDIVVRYCAPAALSAAEWANLLYRRLVLAEATVLSNLTVTTPAGADFEARRAATKTLLAI